ncbi:MAG TPA: hypothetical protein VGI20_05540 [Rhizomicrobium sp.]|jgi:hypothetical protein
MRELRTLLFGCLSLAGLALPPASAAVLIPVPAVSNSTLTTAFAINDNDIIAGSFIGASDGVEHSFFGSLDGTYTTFDAGTGGSEARGINDGGLITGFSNSQNGNTANEPAFERKPGGKIVNVTISGQQLYGNPQGVNNTKGKFAGTRWDQGEHEAVAFVGRRGQWKRDVRIPDEHQASTAGGINSSDVVVGSYFQPPTHGYIVSGKTLTTVDYPSSENQGTTLEGINDNGLVVGQWVDSFGDIHSFLLDPTTNIFTDIKVSGATNVEAWAINTAGAVAVSTDIGSFVWCAKKSQCPSGGTEVAAPVDAVAPQINYERAR